MSFPQKSQMTPYTLCKVMEVLTNTTVVTTSQKVYQVITLHTFTLLNVVCHFYLNKSGKN